MADGSSVAITVLPAAITGLTALGVVLIGRIADARSDQRKWRRGQLFELYQRVITAGQELRHQAPWRTKDAVVYPGASGARLDLVEYRNYGRQQTWIAAKQEFIGLFDEVILIGSEEMAGAMGRLLGSISAIEERLNGYVAAGSTPEDLKDLAKRVEDLMENGHMQLVHIARQELGVPEYFTRGWKDRGDQRDDSEPN
jgi:hypothetical protein